MMVACSSAVSILPLLIGLTVVAVTRYTVKLIKNKKM